MADEAGDAAGGVVRDGESPEDGQQEDGQQEEPAQGSFWRTVLYQIFIFFLIRNVVNLVSDRYGGPAPDGKTVDLGDGNTVIVQQGQDLSSVMHRNLFLQGDSVTMSFYLSEAADSTNFTAMELVWGNHDFSYGEWTSGEELDGVFNKELNITASESLQRNGSMYAHVFFAKKGYPVDPAADGYKRSAVSNASYPLTRLFRRPKVKMTKNLLTGTPSAPVPDTAGTDQSVEEVATATAELITFWHPSVSVRLVTDQNPMRPSLLPAAMTKDVKFLHEEVGYLPATYINDFWDLRENMYPINTTTPYLPLNISIGPISLFKWQMMRQWQDQQKTREEWGTSNDNDADMVKHMLMDTNPVLLGVTMAVSLLHTVFDFLAFKNDIQFWRARKDMVGLSVRTLLVSIVCQFIILLYLFDQETSWLILFSSSIGLVIEVWKARRVVTLTVDMNNKMFGVIPRISYKGKGENTSATNEYDELAFKYLSYVMYPLLLAYAVYSLLYDEHKSWYSFVVGMAAGSVYTFGFIMMTPQLFINYKLKSVAHLPWRMLTYKALNTFIDDLFAFIIKMPTMHRLACFRDDLVFFVYLYQRYAYRVDKTRTNEYGLVPEEGAAPESEAAAPTADQSPAPGADGAAEGGMITTKATGNLRKRTGRASD